jgi:precorrin-6A/cobalt-precorrin-6A reductase
MTKTAHKVCKDLGVEHAILQRPPWTAEQGDKWTFIDSAEPLADLIPEGSNVFVGTGRQTLSDYKKLYNRKLLVRVIDPPVSEFPYPLGRFIIGRPPFSVAHEVAEFQREEIDWLVVKNAGGENSKSKLIAARELGIPVALFNRPKLPPFAITFDTPEAAISWVQRIFSA